MTKEKNLTIRTKITPKRELWKRLKQALELVKNEELNERRSLAAQKTFQIVDSWKKQTKLELLRKKLEENQILTISQNDLNELYSLTKKDIKKREDILTEKITQIERLKKEIEEGESLLRESDESHEELREEKIEYLNKIAALENLSNECKKLAEANKKEQGNFTNSVKLIGNKIQEEKELLEEVSRELEGLKEGREKKKRELERKKKKLAKLEIYWDAIRGSNSLETLDTRFLKLDNELKKSEEIKNNQQELDAKTQRLVFDKILAEKDQQLAEYQKNQELLINQLEKETSEKRRLAIHEKAHQKEMMNMGREFGIKLAESDNELLAVSSRTPAIEYIDLWKKTKKKINKLLGLNEDDSLPDDWEKSLERKNENVELFLKKLFGKEKFDVEVNEYIKEGGEEFRQLKGITLPELLRIKDILSKKRLLEGGGGGGGVYYTTTSPTSLTPEGAYGRPFAVSSLESKIDNLLEKEQRVGVLEGEVKNWKQRVENSSRAIEEQSRLQSALIE